MHFLGRFWKRLLSVPSEPRPWYSVVLWWELRRIPYNVAMLAVGLASLLVIEVAAEPTLKPGEDAFEPIMAIFFGIAANFCYSLGWIVELTARDSIDRARFGPRMFLRGSIVSLVICAIPSILWVPLLLSQLIKR